MTVCIAALAERSRAIVLLSDKALTFGSDDPRFPRMQADTEIEKITSIGKSGWNALTAGSPPIAEKIIREVIQHLSKDGDIAKFSDSMMACFKDVYQEVRKQIIIDQILTRRLLTQKLYIARDNTLLPLPDGYFREVSTEIADFNLDCSLLVCGFDKRGQSHIFSVHDPGISFNRDREGFYVIGVGQETAIGRLLWRGVNRNDSLQEVLYNVLDAKAHAEQIQGVGFSWDAKIIVRGATVNVPLNVKNVIDQIFNRVMESPFSKQPKRTWLTTRMRKLKMFTQRVMKKSNPQRT